ncbi:MAG: hypothetical protein CM1200mP28_03640 [Deltaproteobacteria bacterium]|nr:MAG: hypothetical protein CM1200mP28_03640 [Deltaproteobacteria bacterium]
MDDQEEEKADASADGEEDMVFEETEGQVGDSVEGALDELGEEESTENSQRGSSRGRCSEESQVGSAFLNPIKTMRKKLQESDDSENMNYPKSLKPPEAKG